jgi:hypothetical protein
MEVVYFNASLAVPADGAGADGPGACLEDRQAVGEQPERDMAVVTDRRAAAIFNNLRQRQILLTLIDRQCSLSELSRTTGIALNLLHHHIARLISFGLVKINGMRPRAGAPVKLYRATARTFFVPADLAGAPTGTLNEKLRDVLERNLAGAYKGVVFGCDGSDAQMRLVRDSEFETRVSELWAELELSEAEAGALSREVGAILKRYSGRGAKGRRRYIMHSAIAPW